LKTPAARLQCLIQRDEWPPLPLEPLLDPLPEPEFFVHPALQEFSAALQLDWAFLPRAEQDF
jgi:hypothetical protein